MHRLTLNCNEKRLGFPCSSVTALTLRGAFTSHQEKSVDISPYRDTALTICVVCKVLRKAYSISMTP